MSSDENQPLQFLGKHRSPIDVADEEEPKRRKHHHHHHRHRRNRHRSRHGGDRDEGGNLDPAPEAATGPSAVDDEMEEGEILEDEDDFDSRHNPIGGNFGSDDVVKLSGKGIEEEGRYKGVGEDEGRRDRSRSPVSSKRNTKRQKRSHDEEVLENSGKHEHNEARHGARSTAHSHTKNDSNRENGRGDDVVHPKTQETNKRDLREREKGTGDGRDCSRRGGDGERKGNYENSEDRDGIEAGKVSHREIERGKIERGDKHGSLGRDHEKGRHGTAGDEDHRERERNRSYKEHDEVDVRHDNRGGVRESEEYRCRTNKQSYGKREESSSLSRHDVQEEDKHSGRERERQHGRDANARDGAHSERRSANYSRHDEKGDGHGNWGRDREREGCRSSRNRDRDIIEVGKRSTEERGREREGCWSSRDRDRDRVEVGKRSLGERERSSSYSRHDVHVHRSSSRDGDRERGIDIAERDRDGKRPRDASRDRHGERESVKDAYFERERGRSGSGRDKARTSDIEMHIRQDRERERHSSKDRQRIKLKELAKEGSSARKTSNKDEKPTREEDEDYEEKILQQLAKQEEDDVDKIKEESRKRREAILAKYRQRQVLQAESGSIDAAKEDKTDTDMGKPEELNDLVAICKVSNKALENGHDPSDLCNADPSFALGKSPVLNGMPALEKTAGAGGLGEGTPKSERSADMFCDDIFGELPTGVRKKGKSDILQIEKSGLHDNWDDVEGYYSYRFGEVLDGRYEVVAAHGKGVFSTVVRAKDLKGGKGDPEEVAIKIIRNNETMYKVGLGELTILKKLAGADPDDRRHCVRFLSSLKYRNHLCLVFESLHMNLREVLKKFGRNIGLKLTAVRAYAKQLFIALKHLRNCGILHCDIKPDNMLVNEAKNVLKLCDFGNAMFSGKNEITPYLVSRFYRAPEIILGLPYDHPMDIWSVGCCLYELYTGKVLFPGPSNNDMLRLHMELKGLFPKKMLRKGAFTDQHFDQDLNFLATEEDPVTKKTVKRLLLNIKPRDIGALISGSPGEDLKMLANFKDLLDRIFVLDPEKRMTVSQALSHPFITGK